MSRMSLETVIDHARDLLRDSSPDATYVRLANLAANHLALDQNGKDVWQTIVTAAASSGSTTFTLDASSTSKVGVEPVYLTLYKFAGANLIRYSPENKSYSFFDDFLFRDQKLGSKTGQPLYWTHQNVAGEEGSSTIYVYPALDDNYTATALVNFFPKSLAVGEIAKYVPMAKVVEHLLILATAWYGSRAVKRAMSLEYSREYMDALEIFSRAHADQGGRPAFGRQSVSDHMREREGFVKSHGTAPAVAWDNNPAIPYDPAEPDKGRDY